MFIIVDQITDILRQGARNLLAQALEAEIDHFISQYDELKNRLGRQRIVRNGYPPECTVQFGIDLVPFGHLVLATVICMHWNGSLLVLRT